MTALLFAAITSPLTKGALSMKRPRRNHSAAFKAKVALAAVKRRAHAAIAIGGSNRPNSFGRFAGARFTVIRREVGQPNGAFCNAARPCG